MDSMTKVSLLLFLFSFILFGEINGVESKKPPHHHHHHHNQLHGPKNLFVFGDSYVDTGNIRKSLTVAWRFPYGITFPGKPSGRFSDGRVSTDFLAQLLRIPSPIPYFWKDYVGKERLLYGMNFAYGGTGVFDTLAPLPNMTTQIDLFQKLLTAGDLYSPSHLTFSVALVSVIGNDYSSYLLLGRPLADIPAFINQVVDQIKVNLKRIHAMGVKKIVVPSLPPLGCLPVFAQASSFKSCNDTINALVDYHNSLLHQVVAKLNKETKHSTFVIFDLNNAFSTVFKNKGKNPGRTRFKTPLKPCCKGSCGNVNENGVKQYTLCDDPRSAFFWDELHPTQEGWKSVYSVLGGIINGVVSSQQFLGRKKNPKLFILGDNYLDTGNTRRDSKTWKFPNAVCWKSPYGKTFPGKPSGRFSDGLVATDFLAKVLGAESPYLWRTHGKSNHKLDRGMNFAFGGSGAYRSPNVSSQQMLQLIDLVTKGRVYTFDDFTSSDLAVLSYSTNDYLEYIAINPLFRAYPGLVQFVVNDIKLTLLMLDGLGLKNIGVTSLPPLGCLPHYTSKNSYKSCNETFNKIVELHNNLLKKVVATLKEEVKIKNKGPNFFIIDLHDAFITILNKKGSTRFKNLLKPCCDGDCADIDDKGHEKYFLCDDPKSAFFWDEVNPSQEGWKSIFSILGDPLKKSMTTKG